MKKGINILFLIIVTQLGCTNKQDQLKQSIFLFKDKDGLYLYNPSTEKEKLIFKATDEQVFLDEPFQLSNDIITFGFGGKLTFIDTTNLSKGERYYNYYYSVDLKTGKNWLSKKILYETTEDTKLNIKTLSFDFNGDSIILSDTSMVWQGSSSSYKGIEYNNFKPRFFSKHTLGDKSVFSLNGNIYYTNKLDTTLLVEYKGQFDPKFGSGYYQPQFDPSEQYVVYQYLPGFMNFLENSSLRKVIIKSKKTKRLKTGEFNKPTFSKDGNFILFKRDQKEGKLKTWISKIYLLNLTTLKEHKISDAYSAQWGN